ncbi:hypothetical protein [Sediminibacterium goheungense]|uniref:Uncharacterized protein n=1 Tax=Sediminibacterium goheungense TaxID=1086393 RepID=A0A4R6ISF8_9BACT|nr:hypothetical protein [Sediminibacterium goheungense]TDO25414.1 hypothetical protein BC659_2955 [Sediminibacterium goheungense]
MKSILLNKWAAGIVLALAAISFSAWKVADNRKENQQPDSGQFYQDTTKTKKKYKLRYDDDRDYKIRDLDKAMRELDKASLELDREIKIDMGKMEKELKKAMEEIKKIDVDKIQSEVRKAMKEVELALKEIDFKEVDREMVKVKEELKSEKFKHDIDFSKITREVERGLAEAKEGINTAKKQLTRIKAFVDELDKDGLIDKDKNYKIQVKSHKLYINGKAQSEAVNKKYSKYLDDEDYSISKDAGDEDIEI